MKWLKRLLLLVAVLLLGAMLMSAGGWFLLRGKPAWYHPRTMTAEQRKRAADRAENTLVNIQNWAGGARAARLRASAAAGDLPTTTQAATALAHEPSQPFQIQFTDEELNAFFEKWADVNGRREYLERFIEDPRLVLRDNQLILAGTVKDLGTVVSMQFEPRIDEHGSLQMNLVRVLGGVLPLPDALWASKRARMEQYLAEKLPTYQQAASVAPDGTANSAAASAAMNKLLQSILHGDPAEPALFVPYDVRQLNRSVPVKITAVTVQNNTLTITAEQMTTREREAMMDRLRAPYGSSVTTAAP